MGQITELQAKHLAMFLRREGMTQKELCDELGFSTTTVNRWIKGKARMSESNARMISERWPDYDASWLQGAEADDGDICEMLDRGTDYISKSLRGNDASVRTLADFMGFKVKNVETEPGKHVIGITRKGKNQTMSVWAWENFVFEIATYVGFRLERELDDSWLKQDSMKRWLS